MCSSLVLSQGLVKASQNEVARRVTSVSRRRLSAVGGRGTDGRKNLNRQNAYRLVPNNFNESPRCMEISGDPASDVVIVLKIIVFSSITIHTWPVDRPSS